jgi:hypothetical protein
MVRPDAGGPMSRSEWWLLPPQLMADREYLLRLKQFDRRIVITT